MLKGITAMHEEWTLIHRQADVDRTERMRVPGGWLYRTTRQVYGGFNAIAVDVIAMTFVPDHAELIDVIKGGIAEIAGPLRMLDLK